MVKRVPKKVKLVSFPKDFTDEIDRISEVLKPYMRKTHYSAGNEIQFRYEQFKPMQDLLRQLIKDFIPLELQKKYLDLIPQSQVDFLLLHPAMDYENLLSHLQSALFF